MRSVKPSKREEEKHLSRGSQVVLRRRKGLRGVNRRVAEENIGGKTLYSAITEKI